MTGPSLGRVLRAAFLAAAGVAAAVPLLRLPAGVALAAVALLVGSAALARVGEPRLALWAVAGAGLVGLGRLVSHPVLDPSLVWILVSALGHLGLAVGYLRTDLAPAPGPPSVASVAELVALLAVPAALAVGILAVPATETLVTTGRASVTTPLLLAAGGAVAASRTLDPPGGGPGISRR